MVYGGRGEVGGGWCMAGEVRRVADGGWREAEEVRRAVDGG